MAAVFSLVILLLLTTLQNINGKGYRNSRRVIIHVPYKIKHYYHTHTVIKHILHEKQEDNYEFLGYSVGKPEEIHGEGLGDSAQPYADLGHTFGDNEHTVVGPNNMDPGYANPQAPTMNNEPPPGYMHSDGNEYGFEGAGHHKDDNVGQNIPNYETMNPGVNVESDDKEYGKMPAIEYNFGDKIPGYAKEIMEPGFEMGPKNAGYGREIPESPFIYGGKSENIRNNYEIQNHDFIPEEHVYDLDSNYKKGSGSYEVREHPFDKDIPHRHEEDNGYRNVPDGYASPGFDDDHGYNYKNHGYEKDDYKKVPSFSIDKGAEKYHYGDKIRHDVESNYGPRLHKFSRTGVSRHKAKGINAHYDIKDGEYEYEQEYDYV